MSFIEAEQLRKQYGNGGAVVLAINGVSFDIETGEFVAVMGESGSGKSTLLSILGVLNTPTAGRLFINDVDVYALGQDERADLRKDSIGFVFQNFHLVPYMTILENVMLPLAIVKKPVREKMEMAKMALLNVGLEGKGNRLPGEISGGEQERVAIARAIVNDPLLLLADEPTGNLDSRTARDVMALLGSLNARGTTIVMVTHSNEYSRYANRVLRLVDGRLLA